MNKNLEELRAKTDAAIEEMIAASAALMAAIKETNEALAARKAELEKRIA